MPQYTPPPPNLDHLNPIQRYMQKGQLDRQDWIRLAGLVLAYFVLRPYIQKAAKWLLSDEKVVAGEKAQKEHMERRIAKIGANAIRSGKKQDDAVVEKAGDHINVVTSGSQVDGHGGVVNRKNKSLSSGNKSIEDQLIDWDDEPAREPVKGEKADVKEWLDKWDK